MLYSTQCRCCNNYSPGLEDDKVIKDPEMNFFYSFSVVVGVERHALCKERAVYGPRTQSTGTGHDTHSFGQNIH